MFKSKRYVILFLGELLKEQEHLKHLMGESAEEQRRKLQEKLKLRKQRKAAGKSYFP